jgi:predicted AAA+ superfamily ATPase
LLFQAKPWITETLALAKSNGDPETEANAMLAETLLNLRANAPKAAMASAEPALKFFASRDQKESLWTGYYYMAQAESALNDKEAAKRSAAKSLDILQAFQHNWAVSDFEMYCKRPDVSAARQDLRRIAGL